MSVDPGFVAALADTAALVRAWRVERRDGVVLGFTDCDEPVSYGGLVYEPESGFEGSPQESSTGLSIGSIEVLGIVSSDRITESDIRAGRYDAARVLFYWIALASGGALGALMGAFTIGAISRSKGAFNAELVSLARGAQQERREFYTADCRFDVGDTRCGVNLDAAAYKGAGAVTALRGPRTFVASGLSAFASEFFGRGVLRWTGGANAGLSARVRAHIAGGASAIVEVALPPGAPIAPGDTFAVTAGCDKRVETCRDRFGNARRFGGFPRKPPETFPFTWAREQNTNGGRSFYD